MSVRREFNMEYKKRRLNDAERKRLIALVKAHPVLWNRKHPDHAKRMSYKDAWDNVAARMKMDVETCRGGWRSIRDSARYYKNKAKRKDNGQDVDYSSDNYSGEPWEYTDEIKFLGDPASQSNYSDTLTTDNVSPDRRSTSSYRSNSPTSRQASCLNESMFNVVEIVEYKEKVNNDSFSNHVAAQSSINYSTDMLDPTSFEISSDRSNSPPSTINNTNPMPSKRRKTAESENVSFMNHLDVILHKLSTRSSERLQAKIIALAYSELDKERENSLD